MGLFLIVNVAGKEVLGSSHGCLSKRLVLLGGRSSGPWEFKLAHRTPPSFNINMMTRSRLRPPL